MAPEQAFALPYSVTGSSDVTRLRRELETVDEDLRQQAIRAEQTKEKIKLPKLSRLLDDFLSDNKLEISDPEAREAAKRFLTAVLEHAPVIQMSFAADPSAAFTRKIVTWFRQNIHPLVLVQIGLQPSIAAGATLRTPNHVYDFSLREHLLQQRPALIESLRSMAAK